MKAKKEWWDYLPHGTKSALAKKYGISPAAVAKIIRNGDVINHPDLINEARKIAFAGKEAERLHAEEIAKMSDHVVA